MDRRLLTRLFFLTLPTALSCSSGDMDVVAGGNSAQSTDSGLGSGPLADPKVRAMLREIALQSAAGARSDVPEISLHISAVYSPDYQAAWEAVTGDIVPRHTAVYIIAITGGTFTASDRSAAFGGPPVQGSVFIIGVDAATYMGMGSSIGNTVPDLSKISPDVVDLSAENP